MARREGHSCWECPALDGGRYHSRAARDMTGTGPSRYRGHKRQDVMCRHWRTFGVMLAPFATANCSTLRRTCRRAAPGLFFGLRVSLLPCFRVLRTSLCKQGGTVEYKCVEPS